MGFHRRLSYPFQSLGTRPAVATEFQQSGFPLGLLALCSPYLLLLQTKLEPGIVHANTKRSPMIYPQEPGKKFPHNGESPHTPITNKARLILPRRIILSPGQGRVW